MHSWEGMVETDHKHVDNKTIFCHDPCMKAVKYGDGMRGTGGQGVATVVWMVRKDRRRGPADK